MEANSAGGCWEVSYVGAELDPDDEEDSDGCQDEAGEDCRHSCWGALLRLTEHVLQADDKRHLADDNLYIVIS